MSKHLSNKLILPTDYGTEEEPVSTRHGSLNTHLSEVPANIMADTLHISNLVHNLINSTNNFNRYWS